MSNSLLQVGSQCAHPACSEIDFLPIVCQCSNSYCKAHISSDTHQCPEVDQPTKNPSHLPFDKLHRCPVDKCTKPSLDYSTDSQRSRTCLQCQRSFCVDHRHPTSHSCPVRDTPPPEKNSAGRALLAKNFPSSSSKNSTSRPLRTTTTKVPTNPVKLAQYRKVELMKMRHRAVAGDPKDHSSSSIPIDQRVHLKMKVDNMEKVFWFRRSAVTGKVLDCLAQHGRIRASDASPLQLLGVEGRVLRNDHLISDEAEDGATMVITSIRTPSE